MRKLGRVTETGRVVSTMCVSMLATYTNLHSYVLAQYFNLKLKVQLKGVET